MKRGACSKSIKAPNGQGITKTNFEYTIRGHYVVKDSAGEK